MTRIINILATENVDKALVRQPIEFYLAHKILERPEVYKKVQWGKSYKIVDCSACELGTGVDMKKVLQAARIVKASEIILPDKVGYGMPSLKMSLQALDSLTQKELNEFKIAIVIQGKSLNEACDVLQYLKEHKSILGLIDTIMIPKWFATFQRECLTKLIQQSFPEKQIHWLGLGDDIANCISTAKKLNIRSLDTGYFISIAQKKASNIIKPVRDKHHHIDLEHNHLKDWQVQEVICATNEYDYEAKTENKTVENIKDREFSQLLIRVSLCLFVALITAMILSILM